MADDASTVTTTAPAAGLRNLPFSAEPVRTERLLLRPLRASDLDDVHAYQGREDVVRYLQWEVRDREQTAAHLTQRIAMARLAKDGDSISYALELPDPSGGHSRVVGDLN